MSARLMWVWEGLGGEATGYGRMATDADVLREAIRILRRMDPEDSDVAAWTLAGIELAARDCGEETGLMRDSAPANGAAEHEFKKDSA